MLGSPELSQRWMTSRESFVILYLPKVLEVHGLKVLGFVLHLVLDSAHSTEQSRVST